MVHNLYFQYGEKKWQTKLYLLICFADFDGTVVSIHDGDGFWSAVCEILDNTNGKGTEKEKEKKLIGDITSFLTRFPRPEMKQFTLELFLRRAVIHYFKATAVEAFKLELKGDLSWGHLEK
jgi:hypothetical protein